MVLETIKLVLLILGTLTLTLGPVFLHYYGKHRRAAQRRSLGLPPEKRRTPLLVWLFLGCLIFGAVTMAASLADAIAGNNVRAANHNAKMVYKAAASFAETA